MTTLDRLLEAIFTLRAHGVEIPKLIITNQLYQELKYDAKAAANFELKSNAIYLAGVFVQIGEINKIRPADSGRLFDEHGQEIGPDLGDYDVRVGDDAADASRYSADVVVDDVPGLAPPKSKAEQKKAARKEAKRLHKDWFKP